MPSSTALSRKVANVVMYRRQKWPATYDNYVAGCRLHGLALLFFSIGISLTLLPRHLLDVRRNWPNFKSFLNKQSKAADVSYLLRANQESARLRCQMSSYAARVLNGAV